MTKLVGIVNLTPDSFSDGGSYNSVKDAIAHMHQMAEEGADIIDIGAESTRPGAILLTHAEEWQRLEPVLSQIKNFSIPISLDTYHPQSAAKALDIGVSWINDVSGFQNPDMIAAVKSHNCPLVLMHSLGVPADKHIVLPKSADVIVELKQFLHTRMGYMEKNGIARSRIIFDPGIGFGKNSPQSRKILNRVQELKGEGVPLYIGHSRKSFFGLPANASNAVRDEATLAVSKYLIAQGVDYLRVHNIKRHREVLNG